MQKTVMRKKTVMIVDDDPSVLKAVQHVLEDAGFDTCCAETAAEGLKILERVTPDVILLDMRMPGMSGAGFLNEISGPDGHPKYPVIVQTAYANFKDFFAEVDIDGFLLKPLRAADVVAEVKRVIAAHGGAGAASKSTITRRKRKVLVAEDDPAVAAALTATLGNVGYAVEQVGNGGEVVEKVLSFRPDALVIKQILSGMNGDAVAAILKKIPTTSKLPVLLYAESSNAPTFSEAYLKSKGISVFIRENDPAVLLRETTRLLTPPVVKIS